MYLRSDDAGYALLLSIRAYYYLLDCVAFSADGSVLVTARNGGEWNGGFKLWSVEDGVFNFGHKDLMNRIDAASVTRLFDGSCMCSIVLAHATMYLSCGSSHYLQDWD